MLRVAEGTRTHPPLVVHCILLAFSHQTMNYDPVSQLKELAEQASALNINLSDDITQDQMDRRPRGNYGVVYRGTRSTTGTRVAIKVLHPGPSGGEETIKQVLHEMQRWSILEHENVLQLLGITTMYEQTLSLVTVWMEKGNAHDYVQDQTVDPRPLVAGISRGLQYLHNCKPPIIHGDLKGSNVLISGQGHPLLTDYGLSGLVTASFSVSVSASRSSALNWMAPETMKSETYEVTVKGDVWAFGMTALELFTREVPFSDKKGLLEVRNRVQEGPPDRPRNESTHSRMTDEWWNICSLCWKNQEHRPDISAVISEIEQIGRNPPVKDDITKEAQKPPVKDDITGNEKTTMRSHVETVPPRSSLWVRLRRIFCCG